MCIYLWYCTPRHFLKNQHALFGCLVRLQRLCLGWDVTGGTVGHLGNKTTPCLFEHIEKQKSGWQTSVWCCPYCLNSGCLCLAPESISPWCFLWQQVIVKNDTSHMSVLSYFSAWLIRFSYSLQLASSFSLSLHPLMSRFSLTRCRVTQKRLMQCHT